MRASHLIIVALGVACTVLIAHLSTQLVSARRQLASLEGLAISRATSASTGSGSSDGRALPPNEDAIDPSQPVSNTDTRVETASPGSPADLAPGSVEPAFGALRDRIFAERQKALKDPASREALREEYAMSFRQSMSDLSIWMNIPSDLREQLAQLLAEQKVQMEDALPDTHAEMRKGLDSAGNAEWARRHAELPTLHAQEIEQLLGPERARRWRDYQAKSGPLRQVRDLRGMLGATESLRDDQVRLLADIVSNAEARFSATPPPEGTEEKGLAHLLRITDRKNQEILSAASSALSPAQLRALSSLLQREVESIEIQMRRDSVAREK